jgi:hypothetical protein
MKEQNLNQNKQQSPNSGMGQKNADIGAGKSAPDTGRSSSTSAAGNVDRDRLGQTDKSSDAQKGSFDKSKTGSSDLGSNKTGIGSGSSSSTGNKRV